MRRRAGVALALLLVLGAPLQAGSALADGDPASDVLLGQAVFLGYGSVAPGAAGRLYAVTASAAAHGYPVRVAVIGARTDLGTVPALFGRPAQYAQFLASEVPGTNPILVVMPSGFGLAAGGHPGSPAPLAGLQPASGAPSALADAAATAVERLAAAAGHPLPATAASRQVGASSATIARTLGAIAAMALLAGLGIASAWRARRRAAGAA